MNHILVCLGVKICFSLCMYFVTAWYQRLTQIPAKTCSAETQKLTERAEGLYRI